MARRKSRKLKLTRAQQRTMKRLEIDYMPLAHYRRVKLPEGAEPASGRFRDRRQFLVFRDGTAKPWNGRPEPKQTWSIG